LSVEIFTSKRQKTEIQNKETEEKIIDLHQLVGQSA
jgi:hypothetical protein